MPTPANRDTTSALGGDDRCLNANLNASLKGFPPSLLDAIARYRFGRCPCGKPIAIPGTPAKCCDPSCTATGYQSRACDLYPTALPVGTEVCWKQADKKMYGTVAKVNARDGYHNAPQKLKNKNALPIACGSAIVWMAASQVKEVAKILLPPNF